MRDVYIYALIQPFFDSYLRLVDPNPVPVVVAENRRDEPELPSSGSLKP